MWKLSILVLLGACTAELDSTATRTSELSQDVDLVEVERRKLDDGRVQAKYAVELHGIPIAQLGRRGVLDEKGVPFFHRQLVLTPQARDVDIEKDIGELLAIKAATTRAWTDWSDGQFAVTEARRVLYPRITTKPGFIFIETLQLAYVIDIADDRPRPIRHMRYVIAAADGAVVAVLDPREYLVGTGHGFHAGVTPIQIASSGKKDYLLRDTRRGRVEGLPGITTWNHVAGDCAFASCSVELFLDSNTTFGSGAFAHDPSASEEDLQTAGVDAHRHIERYWDFVDSVYGRVGPLDVDASIDAMVNVTAPEGSTGTTAWFNPTDTPTSSVSRGGMYFSLPYNKGDVPLTMIDAVGHELTHAMTMYELTIWQDDPTFGGDDKIVNEGLADVFGMMLTLWDRGGGGTSIPDSSPGDVWMIGNVPGFRARFFHKPSLDARLVDGVVVQSADAYPPALDSDPHRLAGIVRRAFYFLARGVAARASVPLDQWEEYGSPFLERGLEGVGNDTAALIFYRTIVNALDLRPDYDELRWGVTQETSRIYGECSPEHKAAIDAFAAVGLGDPADREPPAATIFAVQGSGEVIVTTTAFDGADGPHGAQLSVDGFLLATYAPGETSKVTHVSTEFLAQFPWTTHVFTFTVEDACHNTIERTFELTGDFVGPGITVTEEPAPGVNRLLVRVTATDASGLLDATIDLGGIVQTLPLSGTYTTVETTIDFSTLPHGSTPLVVRVRDAFGNTSQRSRTTFLDRLPPSTCQLVLQETDGWNIIVRALTADTDSGPGMVELGLGQTVHWNLDGSTGTTPSRTLVAPDTGSHVAFARCYDRHGNSIRTEMTVDVSRVPTTSISVSSVSRTSATLVYQASDDIALTRWELSFACPDTAALTVLSSATFAEEPPTTSNSGSRTVAIGSVAGGTRCRARITATDSHDNTRWREEMFTVPADEPPPLITISESEPNDTIQTADVIATNVGRINAVGEKEWTAKDYFRIELAPGQRVTVGHPVVPCLLFSYMDAAGTDLRSTGELADATVPPDWDAAGSYIARRFTNVTTSTKSYYIQKYRIITQPPNCSANSVQYHILFRRN